MSNLILINLIYVNCKCDWLQQRDEVELFEYSKRNAYQEPVTCTKTLIHYLHLHKEH